MPVGSREVKGVRSRQIRRIHKLSRLPTPTRRTFRCGASKRSRVGRERTHVAAWVIRRGPRCTAMRIPGWTLASSPPRTRKRAMRRCTALSTIAEIKRALRSWAPFGASTVVGWGYCRNWFDFEPGPGSVSTRLETPPVSHRQSRRRAVGPFALPPPAEARERHSLGRGPRALAAAGSHPRARHSLQEGAPGQPGEQHGP